MEGLPPRPETAMTSVEYLGPTASPNPTTTSNWGGTASLLARFATPAEGAGRCATWAAGWAPCLPSSPSGRRLDRVGIELNPGAAALARQNLADNGLAGEILPGDLRDRTLLAGDRFHLVVSNPPYFRAGSASPGPGPDGRHLLGHRPLPGGGAAGPHRGAVCPGLPPRAAGGALCRPGGGPAGAQADAACWPTTAGSPPYAVLVEAVKDGGPGLEVLPVHYQMEP